MRGRLLISLFLGALSLILWESSSRGILVPPASVQTSHNTVDTVIVEPAAGMTPLLTAIQAASSSIDVVMYEFEDPAIAQALAKARSRGINVRVLLNGGYYGKKENTNNDKAYQYLIAHDILVHWSPAGFALTHQKTIVVDDTRAYILTFNFTPQYYASSRDFGIVDSDMPDVSEVVNAFNADWNNEDYTPLSNTRLVWSPGSEKTLIDLIAGTTKTLDIYNQEMADKKILTALKDAETRGVQIRIVMTDNKKWYDAWTELSKVGTQVHTYDAKAPTYIHAKVILADNTKMFVGSENFSLTSLQRNRELGIITSDTNAISQVEQTFETDWGVTSLFTN
ncbi:MAG: phosphatidylserine/phosphatidylglycerophosphate/cardiolipin synthase-like protein [Candidatus Kaiserbacteria bacterium]|nr:phosphatidylserine/phosphatidylglycerophosphate/cardiolipin synthase-like protein [Candidatus Kaiserbacteria bacterium]